MANNHHELHVGLEEEPKLKFAVNTCGRNKEWDFKKLAANFQDKEGTIQDVQYHIKAGHAVCGGLLGGKWRTKANIIGSQWLLLDIDNSDIAHDAQGKPIKNDTGNYIKLYKHQLTIEEALAHPFVKKYCSLIYTTANHQPNWHRFRLIFILPEYIEGADTVESCTYSLMQQLPHDCACKDASRVFYGNTEAEFVLVNPEATLPDEWVREAIRITQEQRIEYQLRIQEIELRHKECREISGIKGWDIDELIRSALSLIPPRVPGSGNYNECCQVLMALVNQYGASEAEIIAEKWSPSIKGTTWNIRTKIRSFKRRGITIGTLFYIAKQYGFQFPKGHYKLSQNYKGLISRQEWEARQIREDLTSFQNLLKQVFTPLFRPAKGFSIPVSNKLESTIEKPTLQITTRIPQPIIYKQGNIPYRSEFTGDIYIECQPTEHIDAWVEAIYKGWTQILDNSHPGLGKSYNAGKLTAAMFGTDRLIYQDANHRNPSTLPVETNFIDLPVRHDGLKIDTNRTTPTGNYFLLQPKTGEIPDTPSNCSRTSLFSTLRNKNFASLDFDESAISPICKGCINQNLCCFTYGDGFGFRFLKRMVIQNYAEIRAHPDSTPVTLTNAANKPFTVGRIWEEAGTLIKPVRSIEVGLRDFDNTVGSLLAGGLPNQEWLKLQQSLPVLRSLLNGDIKPNSRYGFNDTEMREQLGEFPSELDIGAIRQILQPNFDFLADLDSTDIDPDQELPRTTPNTFGAKCITREIAQQGSKKFSDLPNYWFPDFLEAWKGQGSLACKWGVLTIYRPNHRYTDLACSARFNIYLDATIGVERLKLKLACNDSMLVIQQSRPSYSNLTVVNVRGLGKLPKKRSTSLTQRVLAIKDTLHTIHKKLGIIEWKELALKMENYIEYSHFVDGRGVNRFSDCDVIASFGIPYQNIGVVAAHIKVMTGQTVKMPDSDGILQNYLTESIRAEIIQEIGRLRAHRRSNEELIFYFCADYDLTFLLDELPGVKLKVVDACTLCTEAGSRDQQTGHAIVKAFTQLWESQQKIGQTAIAKIIDSTQAWVSRFTQRWGGWSKFKKLLLLLLESFYSKSNKSFADLSDDEIWFAREYFPMLIDEAVSSPEDTIDYIAKRPVMPTNTVIQRVFQKFTSTVNTYFLAVVLHSLPTELYSYFIPLQAAANPKLISDNLLLFISCAFLA